MATRRVELGESGQTVRDNIARVRREQRLTLRDVADRLAETNRPLAHNTISEIERGARRVDVDDLVAIAIALDVSPNTLLTPWGQDNELVVKLTGARPQSLRDFTSFLEGMRSLRGTGLSFAIRCTWPWMNLFSGPSRLVSEDDLWIGKLVDTDGETVQYNVSFGMGSKLAEIEKLQSGEDV